MIPETVKTPIEELSREEFITTALAGYQGREKKRRRSRKKGAKFGHEKQERAG